MQKLINIERKKKKSFFPHLLIVAGGLLLFIDSVAFRILGVVVMFLGFFASFSKTGILLDIKNKKYRQYICFLRIYMGKWESLPEIRYIAIVRVRMSRLKFRPSEISFRQMDDSFDIAYDVNLIFDNAVKRYLKIFNGELKEAKELCLQISQKLNLRIFDSSTSQKKWIETSELESFV